jgi:hypothetical protein
MSEPWVEVVFVDFVFEVGFRVKQTNEQKELETVVERHEKQGQTENVLQRCHQCQYHPVQEHLSKLMIDLCFISCKNDPPKNTEPQNHSLRKDSKHCAQ